MLFTFFFILHSNVCRHGIETLPGHYTFPSSRMDARRSRSCPWIVVTRDTMQNQLARKFEHGESHESRSKELGEKLGRIRSEFRNARVSEVTCQSPWQRHLVSHDQNPQQFGKTTSTALTILRYSITKSFHRPVRRDYFYYTSSMILVHSLDQGILELNFLRL